jgi:hypothetical protein
LEQWKIFHLVERFETQSGDKSPHSKKMCQVTALENCLYTSWLWFHGKPHHFKASISMNVFTYRWSIVLTTAITISTLQPAVAEDALNQLTEKEKGSGWKLLFDGKTTEGWRNYKKSEIGSGWKVTDGALTRTAEGAGDIITKDEYGAFELSLEYKISKGGNSGLMFHVGEEGNAPWHTGPEIQIQDNEAGRDPQKAGWLYQLYKSDTDATKPAGEWNQLRIVISPEKCEQYMNGVKYCEYVKGSDDWNARVAKSKFAKMPQFGKLTRGHICLQDHGNEVAFRNIKIRVLE